MQNHNFQKAEVNGNERKYIYTHIKTVNFKIFNPVENINDYK